MSSSAQRVPVLMLVTVVSISLVLPSCGRKQTGAGAQSEFQKKTQEALILAKPGAVIELPEGKFQLDRQLSLTVDNVTLRGKGMQKTVLSFANQKAGASGMLVNASGFTLEDLALEDTKGDALKVTGGTDITIRRVRTEWTGGPKTSNGSYGIYPVQCKNVLVEDSVVIGAADAGIYVGQSSNIIVRRNRVEYNVAGIEIENSQHADVDSNVATHNTGGILVFNLPDLPVKDGKYTRIFNNQVVANDTENFGAPGAMVSKVPRGTGIVVLATRYIDVFKNTVKDNATANVQIISYLSTENPMNDPHYDPYTGSIYVHDNEMSGGGTDPSGLRLKAIALALGKPLGDILYDGVVDTRNPNAKEDSKICIQNNGGATFLNLDAGNDAKHPSRDLAPHNCSFPALEAVNLPAATSSGAAGGGR